MRRVLTAIASLALVGAMATPAQADFNIATGLKWVPLRYTQPFGAVGNGAVANRAELYGWQTTSLDPYIAFFFTENIGLSIGLDLGYANAHLENSNNPGPINTKTITLCATPNQPCDVNFFQFGFTLGGKFYLARPTAQRVSPYFYVDFYKYFASINTSDAVNPDRVGAIASLAAPLGFNAAFGAEYFFTTSFSLGAEVLGVRFAHIGGDWGVGDGTRDSYSNNYITLYTGITINYRFLATASVRTYEEDEDRQSPRPAPRRKRPRPVEPPPEDDGRSPESVD